MTRYSLKSEAWREYDFNGRVYRIDRPRELFLSLRGTTHRVVDCFGIVHCCPAPGQNGCVLRWSPKNASNPVDF
ncbi:hypothetical protein LCGC14_0220150 [marine sediment metagenome]|uniref:Uncharacterized protein n=1 Tax=marine sediment metagenome TaxID=412755 RepID=A0A0F9UD87_9ZZZZ